MKQKLIIFFFFLSSLCFSQDVIITKKGEKISCKVLKVEQSQLDYKKISNLEGPTYSILKSNVASVTYKNGDVEVFTENEYSQDKKNQESTTPGLHKKIGPGSDNSKVPKQSMSQKDENNGTNLNTETVCSLALDSVTYVGGKFFSHESGAKLSHKEVCDLLNECSPVIALKYKSGCKIETTGFCLFLSAIGWSAINIGMRTYSSPTSVYHDAYDSWIPSILLANVSIPMIFAGGRIMRNCKKRFYRTYMINNTSYRPDTSPVLLNFYAGTDNIGLILTF